MDQCVYKGLLVNTEETMLFRWGFMHSNNPKHISRTVLLAAEGLSCPAQSPNHNVNENVWSYGSSCSRVKLKYLHDLWTEIQKAWLAIPVERYMSLMNRSMCSCY